MTTEDVLEELELGDEIDDPDEPMIFRSDDEFSDCDLDENEDNDDSNEDNTNVPTSSQPQPQKVTSGASSAPPPQWLSSLSTVSISDFIMYVFCWSHSYHP